MRKKLYAALAVLLALVLAVSLFMLAREELDGRTAAVERQQAGALAGVDWEAMPTPPPPEETREAETAPPPDEVALALAEVDLEALRAENGEVVGWLHIPNTEISHPLVQGSDNQYYLKHTWNGQKSSFGAVFLDCQVDPGLEGFNTIVYAHNMRRDGVMFSDLDRYAGQDYWPGRTAVYVAIPGRVLKYELFAAWEAGLTDTAYYLDPKSAARRQELIDQSLERSAVDAGVTPTVEDRVLTLSTCNDYGRKTRWVVQAVLRQQWDLP